MKKLIVLSGAGISQESGIPTYRDMGGLWQKYNFEELASPQAWNSNPELVLEFYNARRKQLLECEPNKAHKLLVELENKYYVQIVTQNVDDLHERAGSSSILHLHGEIRKARSTQDSSYIVPIKGGELNIGDVCPNGTQLRPNIVWFGEAVSEMENAVEIVRSADILVVIGTSLNVYPAASLVHYAPNEIPKYIIDPQTVSQSVPNDFELIKEKACKGVEKLIQLLSD